MKPTLVYYQGNKNKQQTTKEKQILKEKKKISHIAGITSCLNSFFLRLFKTAVDAPTEGVSRLLLFTSSFSSFPVFGSFDNKVARSASSYCCSTKRFSQEYFPSP
jgi:hypothetical protein